MLGHKNMNLNIKQCLPAPKNTLTLQAICLNIKKIYITWKNQRRSDQYYY